MCLGLFFFLPNILLYRYTGVYERVLQLHTHSRTRAKLGFQPETTGHTAAGLGSTILYYIIISRRVSCGISLTRILLTSPDLVYRDLYSRKKSRARSISLYNTERASNTILHIYTYRAIILSHDSAAITISAEISIPNLTVLLYLQ